MPKKDSKLSLRPLKFKEAVADLLKVKPPAKAPKKSRSVPKPKHKKREA
jgi:hypothetical protein